MNESRVERRLPASPRRLFWPGVVVAVGLVHCDSYAGLRSYIREWCVA